MDSNGDIFGTTQYGGVYNDGTIFEIPKGTNNINTLISFGGSDGANPTNSLTLDAAGNLWGTTEYGGGDSDGEVFEVPAGETNQISVFSFNGTNGSKPMGGVIFDSNGNLYGTTSASTNAGDYGTIYEIANGTGTITTLAKFDGTDGDGPSGTIAMDSSGDIWGTCPYGGAYNDGTLFEWLTAGSAIDPVYSFQGSDGALPLGGVAISGSNIYGTTAEGGYANDGTVFEYSKAGGVSTLYQFGGPDGEYPQFDFSMDSSGNLYSTTLSSSDGNSVLFWVSNGG
jgi:uncharacterized repeat protein (TIGR03803 family)